MTAAFNAFKAKGFVGPAKRLEDIDLPRIGALIGVGEDEIHAIIDVESSGSGFDKLNRPKMLFEPHVFWRHLGPGAKRKTAEAAGVAYQTWKSGNYPSDSYPRLARAMAIDETAAIKSCSWGLTQILGENFKEVGYDTPQAMVAAMCEGEAAHLAATVALIRSKGLAGALKARNWPVVARGWNGPGYAKNKYDDKLAARFKFWNKIPDTPYDPKAPVIVAKIEVVAVDPVAQAVTPVVTKTVDLTVPTISPTPVAQGSKWAQFGSKMTAFFTRKA
jgi:hypothetical protein